MRDCPDGAMRDQLPLFVSGALDDAEYARVEAHLRSCADCSEEVALLRATVRAFDVAPMDAATIAAKLPTARAARKARPFHRQPLWRVAATITMMIAGTATVMVVRQPELSQAPVTGVDSGSAVGAPGRTGTGSESTLALATGTTPSGITFGNNLADLTDAQLEALLASLDRIDGRVAAEPETLNTPVVPNNDGGSN